MKLLYICILFVIGINSANAEGGLNLKDVVDNVKEALEGRQGSFKRQGIGAIAHVTVSERSYTVTTKNNMNSSKFERIYPEKHITLKSTSAGVFQEDHLANTRDELSSQMAEFVEEQQFHWKVFHFDDLENLKLAEKTLFHDCFCHQLVGKNKHGSPVIYMIDPENWLPYGQIFMPGGDPENKIDILYMDWETKRHFNGFRQLVIYDRDLVFNYRFGEMTTLGSDERYN